MKPHLVLHKAINKTVGRAAQLLRWDWLTRTRISFRSDLEEIGSPYGGWVVPVSLFDESTICYCVGCGEDITFDLGLIERFGSKVFGFDPTPRSIAHIAATVPDQSSYVFIPIGMWDKDDTLRFYTPADPSHVSHSLLNLQRTDDYLEVEVKSITTLMSALDHESVDFIKLDIEGAEYKVIESIMANSLEIETICVEFDEWFNPLDRHFAKRIRRSVQSLTDAGYQLVCAQRNGNYTFTKAS